MFRTGPFVLASMIVVAAMSPAMAQKSPDETSARLLVADLTNSRFDNIPDAFDPTMKAKLPVGQIRMGWNQAIVSLGKFTSIGKPTTTPTNGMNVVVVPCNFENGQLNVQVTYSKTHQISGLYLTRPVSPPSTSKSADLGHNEKAARLLIDRLHNNEYARVTEDFDDTMKSKLSTVNLQSAWTTIIRHLGAFQSQEKASFQNIGDNNAVIITCKFLFRKLDVKVVYDKKHKVAGLFFIPQSS